MIIGYEKKVEKTSACVVCELYLQVKSREGFVLVFLIFLAFPTMAMSKITYAFTVPYSQQGVGSSG